MVRIAGGADVARGSELARSAARLLTNAPDVAAGRAAARGGSVELRRLLWAVR